MKSGTMIYRFRVPRRQRMLHLQEPTTYKQQIQNRDCRHSSEKKDDIDGLTLCFY